MNLKTGGGGGEFVWRNIRSRHHNIQIHHPCLQVLFPDTGAQVTDLLFLFTQIGEFSVFQLAFLLLK